MKQRIITAVIALLALLGILFYAPQELALLSINRRIVFVLLQKKSVH